MSNKKYRGTYKGETVGYGAKGYTIKPGTPAGDSYCARSLGIQKKHGKTAANTLSRRRWGMCRSQVL